MFERFYVTSRGKTLEARTHAGEEITFTRMQIGSGSLPEGQSIEALTALITPIKYLPVSSAMSTGSTAIIQGQVTNNGIASSFAFREIGLFATDPIDGEILYAYANAGNNADLIPAYSTTPVEFTFSFNISFTNTSNVTVVIDSSLAFYTKAEMDAALADKLDIAAVYNDLDQTDEGFVLDARQGRKLAESIEEITATPLVLTIPSGQWSGTGSDRYITVTASNVTANSIIVPHCDNTSAALLKGPIWCVPAAGSFTLHTSAVPAGTVNVLIQFVGTLGEANYQVLADVYSKAQTDEKIQQSTADKARKIFFDVASWSDIYSKLSALSSGETAPMLVSTNVVSLMTDGAVQSGGLVGFVGYTNPSTKRYTFFATHAGGDFSCVWEINNLTSASVTPTILNFQKIQTTELKNCNDGIVFDETYVDTSAQLELNVRTRGIVCTLNLTFVSKTNISASGTILATGLPKAAATSQFTAMEGTNAEGFKPIMLRIDAEGRLRMGYMGTIASGHAVRLGYTYVLAD